MKMKNIKLLVLFCLILGNHTALVSQLRLFKKSKLQQIKPRSKTSLHINFGSGSSSHYLSPLTHRRNNPLSTSRRKPLKQESENVTHLNFSINHLLFPKQEVYFGLGSSTFAFKENGEDTRISTTTSTRVSRDYTHSYLYEYLSIFIGHRYIFPSKTNKSIFLENSLANDWNLFFEENDFINRSGFSYQVKFGGRIIYKDKRKILASLYFRTAVVKYNLLRFDKNYYPYAFGVDLAFALSFKQ